jgi:moderate conductance mechanosensitive channel
VWVVTQECAALGFSFEGLQVVGYLWHAAKAAIDNKLAATAELGQPNSEEARRRARMHTLLPIFRNVLFVLVIAVAAMMALAELGSRSGH